MNHNYIGTEHVLLGLLRQPEGIAHGVLQGVGVTLDGTREQVAALVGPGKKELKGHIPFTPRAKKILELSLREALALHSSYIGTEHILLGLLREGEGVAAQILRSHADLLAIRASVLDLVPVDEASETRESVATAAGTALRRMRGLLGGGRETVPEQDDTITITTFGPAGTPAADATLAEAARLAQGALVGSHHLLLAALADPDSAAARVFARLGVDLDRAKEALRSADVTGTSDELPEEAGRRQMSVQVTDEALTIVCTDPVIVAAGKAALQAVHGNVEAGGSEAGGVAETGVEAGGLEAGGVGGAGIGEAGIGEAGGPAAAGTIIRGEQPAAASFASVWQALHASLTTIAGSARPSADA